MTSPSPTHDSPEIEIIVEDSAWNSVAHDLTEAVGRAARLAFERAAVAESASEIAILLSGDDRLRTLNREHRKKNKPTNVLSFPAPPKSKHLGDIAIAYGTARREADAAGKPPLHHLLHLTAHGVLHLLGYDHEEPAEAERMEALEVEILAELKIPNPYLVRDKSV